MLMTIAVLLCSATVHAYDYDFEVDGIYYNIVSLTDLTVEVTRSDNAYSGEVVIPSTVTYKSKVLDVISIDKNAFRGSEKLTKVSIGKNVTTIEERAFENCTGLTEITIPDNVTSIGDAAFLGCYDITYVAIGTGITKLDASIFGGCRSVKELRIEDSEEEILLPHSRGSFYESAFSDCPLENIYLGRDINHSEYASPFGKSLKSVVVGKNVTTIEERTFENCTGLTEITIPDNVTSIEKRAFEDCTGLTNIRISNNIVSIAEYTFSGCSSLTTITIPERSQLTSIGERAFLDSSSLTAITIPEGVTEIGYGAFYNCSALEKIYLLCATPPTVNDSFTNTHFLNTTVYVPVGALETYQAADVWKNFWDIREEGKENPNVEVKKCATPTISYEGGKLNITSETEGVEFVTEITNSDITKHYTSMIELAVTYNVSTYAKLSGYENSDVTYATLCWIESDDAGSDLTQIKSTPVLIKSNEGSISISGVKANTEITVYDINGNKVSAAVADGNEVVINTSLSKNDTAIIHIGDKVIKIIMR